MEGLARHSHPSLLAHPLAQALASGQMRLPVPLVCDALLCSTLLVLWRAEAAAGEASAGAAALADLGTKASLLQSQLEGVAGGSGEERHLEFLSEAVGGWCAHMKEGIGRMCMFGLD